MKEFSEFSLGSVPSHVKQEVQNHCKKRPPNRRLSRMIKV